MLLSTLMLAGALAFGHGAAVDQRPYAAGRSNAIIEAARSQGATAAAPDATAVRYPSADGDILAGTGAAALPLPPLQPRAPIAAVFPPMRAPSTNTRAVDGTGLLGGPRQ
jgi:hypothetical protein